MHHSLTVPPTCLLSPTLKMLLAGTNRYPPPCVSGRSLDWRGPVPRPTSTRSPPPHSHPREPEPPRECRILPSHYRGNIPGLGQCGPSEAQPMDWEVRNLGENQDFTCYQRPGSLWSPRIEIKRDHHKKVQAERQRFIRLVQKGASSVRVAPRGGAVLRGGWSRRGARVRPAPEPGLTAARHAVPAFLCARSPGLCSRYAQNREAAHYRRPRKPTPRADPS